MDARISAWLVQARDIERLQAHGEAVSPELVQRSLVEAIGLITALVANHDAPQPVHTQTPHAPGERRRRRSKAP